MLVTRRNMLAEDARLSNEAVRTLVAIERQNQVDDLAYDPLMRPGPLTGEPAQQNVQVVINLPDNGRGPRR